LQRNDVGLCKDLRTQTWTERDQVRKPENSDAVTKEQCEGNEHTAKIIEPLNRHVMNEDKKEKNKENVKMMKFSMY
jgi:hypothetical protein